MVIHPIKNIISLFSGIGGLDLAVKLVFPEARTVAFCERESYAAATLVARMEDKTLDEAPIWSDITTFEGKPWRGKVDCLIGGFPCQDISHSGKRAGISEGTRSGLFYQYARLISEIRPRYTFVENVAGLLDNRAMGVVLGEFSSLGLTCEWGMFSAAECGSTHQRKRIFLLAHSDNPGVPAS